MRKKTLRESGAAAEAPAALRAAVPYLALAAALVSGCTFAPQEPFALKDHGIRFPAMQELASPNYEPRPRDAVIDTLVIHYTGMESAGAALDLLRDRRAKVSAHYLIDEDGAVVRLVGEKHRAWHAGAASWRGETNINDRSVGIELVNPGHEFGYRPFPEPQMKALERLAAGILRRNPIPPERVLGHSDVAPLRKKDPGELFDWERLARAGIGLWPGEAGEDAAAAAHPSFAEAQRLLKSFGYKIAASGVADEETRLVVAAFQRHFRPRRVDGEIDPETVVRLRALVEQSGAEPDEGGAVP